MATKYLVHIYTYLQGSRQVPVSPGGGGKESAESDAKEEEGVYMYFTGGLCVCFVDSRQ